jgi:hypothetical protein
MLNLDELQRLIDSWQDPCGSDVMIELSSGYHAYSASDVKPCRLYRSQLVAMLAELRAARELKTAVDAWRAPYTPECAYDGSEMDHYRHRAFAVDAAAAAYDKAVQDA